MARNVSTWFELTCWRCCWTIPFAVTQMARFSTNPKGSNATAIKKHRTLLGGNQDLSQRQDFGWINEGYRFIFLLLMNRFWIRFTMAGLFFGDFNRSCVFSWLRFTIIHNCRCSTVTVDINPKNLIYNTVWNWKRRQSTQSVSATSHFTPCSKSITTTIK